MLKRLNIEDILLNYSDLKLHFNPFGGVTNEDLWSIFVEKPYSGAILDAIKDESPKLVELKAWHGRGKTTHLRYFHRFFPASDILMLDRQNTKVSIGEGDLIFVDSIQHLSFAERQKILKNYKRVVATTHLPRMLDCYIANKKRISFQIKGLTEKELLEMITKRIQWASYGSVEVEINPLFLKKMVKKNGDNVRAILQFLYAKMNA